MEKTSMVKIGVIGVGRIGKIHIEQILKNPQTQLTGFFDIDNVRSAEIVAEFSLLPFVSLNELLLASDAILIATNTEAHYEIALKCIKSGKHVFIEKPITIELSQALELVHSSKESNVKCMVGHVERFNPAFVLIRPFVTNPLFIESHRLATFSSKLAQESVILDLMIHDIDIVLSLVKSEINRISATGVKVISDTIDIANARIEFSNGCIANLTASRISQNAMRKTRVFQQDAYFNIDFLNRKSERVSLKSLKNNDTKRYEKAIHLTNGDTKYLHIDEMEDQASNAIYDELENFVDAIIGNKTPLVSAEIAYEAMDVAHKIIKKINFFND
jgi:predicted dehydrogenase